MNESEEPFLKDVHLQKSGADTDFEGGEKFSSVTALNRGLWHNTKYGDVKQEVEPGRKTISKTICRCQAISIGENH